MQANKGGSGNALPHFRECDKEPLVYDARFSEERNELDDLDDFSYAHTYLAIHDQSDSLERERIRLQTAALARTLIEVSYPSIERVSDSIFRLKDYNAIGKRVALIRSSETLEKKRQQCISDLLVPSETDKQLFIEIRTYRYRNTFRNVINVYVFGATTLRLLYYDKLAYHCDIRDKEGLTRVLHYALEKFVPREH